MRVTKSGIPIRRRGAPEQIVGRLIWRFAFSPCEGDPGYDMDREQGLERAYMLAASDLGVDRDFANRIFLKALRYMQHAEAQHA